LPCTACLLVSFWTDKSDWCWFVVKGKHCWLADKSWLKPISEHADKSYFFSQRTVFFSHNKSTNVLLAMGLISQMNRTIISQRQVLAGSTRDWGPRLAISGFHSTHPLLMCSTASCHYSSSTSFFLSTLIGRYLVSIFGTPRLVTAPRQI